MNDKEAIEKMLGWWYYYYIPTTLDTAVIIYRIRCNYARGWRTYAAISPGIVDTIINLLRPWTRSESWHSPYSHRLMLHELNIYNLYIIDTSILYLLSVVLRLQLIKKWNGSCVVICEDLFLQVSKTRFVRWNVKTILWDECVWKWIYKLYFRILILGNYLIILMCYWAICKVMMILICFCFAANSWFTVVC